jgi:hypothetical protein
MIDTLKVARSFEDAGFAKAQAESLAVAIGDAASAGREDLVTKDFLRSELSVLRSELRGEIVGTKGELRAEIASAKHEMIHWLLGSQVMLVALLAALANFTKVFG